MIAEKRNLFFSYFLFFSHVGVSLNHRDIPASLKGSRQPLSTSRTIAPCEWMLDDKALLYYSIITAFLQCSIVECLEH